mgnify:CR=1 FL=1
MNLDLERNQECNDDSMCNTSTQIRTESGVLLSSDASVVAKSAYYWNLYTSSLLDTITLLGQ